jgi:hypothetical protein
MIVETQTMLDAALFCLGVTVWLLGLAIRITIRLFQLVVLILWAGIMLYQWQRRRAPQALDGEILPPEREPQRALSLC